MPGENIQDWSTTAATNGSADSLINWAEGQPRASVNNSARSMMAAHAKDRNLQNGSIVTGGTANAQTFASGLSYTTVPTGLRVLLKIGPALTNTGAVTLNMDGIGGAAVKNETGLAFTGGEFLADSYAELVYDGTSWICLAHALRKGVTDGSDAPAGYVGEYIIQTGLVTPSFGNNIWAQIGVVSLSAGDWNVSGGANIIGLASSGVFYLSIGLVTATANPIPGYIATVPGFPDIWAITGPVRLSLAAATNVYLNALNSTPTAGNLTASQIQARRVR